MRLTLGGVMGGALTFLLAISAPLQGAGLRAGVAEAAITPLPRVFTTISVAVMRALVGLIDSR